MTLIAPSTRHDLRPASAGSVPASPLGGSYITTSRTMPQTLRAPGSYVTANRSAPATPNGYVTTEVRRPVSGGSYTYTG
ncbi:hypothetical protein [Arthrobacter antioxidans]|uniref:hypothetical protein n=1 Tax=Arthrobacter antioxidans TaxID=2895818 RepID=UPI001FFFE791|nr:hypothetical protein [Arthrobacter antioxidans]